MWVFFIFTIKIATNFVSLLDIIIIIIIKNVTSSSKRFSLWSLDSFSFSLNLSLILAFLHHPHSIQSLYNRIENLEKNYEKKMKLFQWKNIQLNRTTNVLVHFIIHWFRSFHDAYTRKLIKFKKIVIFTNKCVLFEETRKKNKVDNESIISSIIAVCHSNVPNWWLFCHQ